MKKLTYLIFSLALCSCNFFDKKIPDKNVLLEERLSKIDWCEPTRYPSISTCVPVEDKSFQRCCFLDYTTHSVRERLSVDTLSILYHDIDTINVKVVINPDATLIFEPQFPDNFNYGKEKIDSIIKIR